MNGAEWKAYWKKECETYTPLPSGNNTLFDIFEACFEYHIFFRKQEEYLKAIQDLQWHCRTVQGVLDILHYLPEYLSYLYKFRKYKREHLFHLYSVFESVWYMIGEHISNKIQMLFDDDVQNALDANVIWWVEHHSKIHYFEECYQKKELRTAFKFIDLIHKCRLPKQMGLLKEYPRIGLEELAMYVWHPSRVERKIETYGFDYFDMV